MRILVVEDEERIATFLVSGLRAEGWLTASVATRAAASSHLLHRPPDVVILDLGLEDGDGLDLLTEIGERRPQTVVLILSARRDTPTRLAGLRRGAVDFVSKPFSLDELIERIRIHTRSGGHERATASSRLALDARTRTVDLGIGSVTLTDLEFRLLEYLSERPQVTIGRDVLLSDVWGLHHEVTTNVVDVTVRRLRRKIGEDVIETVRNGGYRLAHR